jgi:hypothetical protein
MMVGRTITGAKPARVFPGRLSPEQRRGALEAAHWTVRDVALSLGYAVSTVRQWLDGRTSAPFEVDLWLFNAGKFHLDNPPPQRK